MRSFSTSPYARTTTTDLESMVGGLGFLFLCLNALFFSSLIAADPWTFHALRREDYWMENLTAVWFLLAGLSLFFTAWLEWSVFCRCIYVLCGMAMVFAAGEEISWGQRIFGFATPEFLVPLNEQREFNVHNMDTGMFDSIYRNGALILCMVTSASFFCRKERLFGIPLPSILLMLGFLLILSYETEASLRGFSNFRGFSNLVVSKEKGLLLLFLFFTLLSRQVKLVIATTATLALVWALSYVNYHSFYQRPNEAREYLFGVGCLFYSLELMLAQGRFSVMSRAPFTVLKVADRRMPLWLMTCALAVLGSIWLIFLTFKYPWSSTVASEEAYWSVVAGEPAARSVFDVYLLEDELAYIKEPCALPDIEPPFSLHVIPADAKDLAGKRKRHGYDNLDFRFDAYSRGGLRSGGKCFTVRRLPDYEIASIRTGQYIPRVGPVWKVEFPVERGQGR